MLHFSTIFLDSYFNVLINHLIQLRELAYQKLRQQKQRKIESDKMRSHGKLKIMAYNNFGHLTVHIIKGKHYYHRLDTTYVRIDVLPDEEKFYKHYQTPILKAAKQTDTLNYNEKFSFEVIYLICLDNKSKIPNNSILNSSYLNPCTVL